MSRVLTAEEFLRGKPFSIESIHSNMIQFAKLHVEAALKAASESRCINMYDKTWVAQSLEPGTKILDTINITVNKESILKAYPLKNIK